HHQREKNIFDAIGIITAQLHKRCSARIENNEIGIVARSEAADAVVEIECRRAAACGEGKRAQWIQSVAAQLRNFVGLVERLQLRKTRARADIGTEPDTYRTIRFFC